MNLDDYNYLLPEKNLALSPAVPRDSSKLFIYETAVDKITFDHFYNLDRYLPKDSFMVMNNTKVLPARVTMKKENGGKVILLFLVNELTSLRVVKVMADRKITVGEKIYFNQENFLEIISQKENIFDLQFNFNREHLFFLLKKYGAMPIPPYLKKSPLSRDDLLKKYQTIFAKTDGSSAAPTASLHFTDSVFDKLEKKGIERLFVTLHVGLGTFAPIIDKNIQQKKLHNEYYEIDEKTLQSIKRLKYEEKKLVAVGTTVVRTIESEARYRNFLSQRRPLHPESEKNLASSPLKKTNLFILPPYDFKMVDVMITNFHLPKSSLMMLVEAFLQYKWAKLHLVDLYNIAIKNDFRFYSFGDAMLIL
ncbi:MAG: tRNA preQ1(34) S-adenosylmethionine ribosyltransferase-isomerase QueA [Patescibacteria group bacterium]|jgi:S-adenosylmethionine:tRNA ribosyltransferase-isomerase